MTWIGVSGVKYSQWHNFGFLFKMQTEKLSALEVSEQRGLKVCKIKANQLKKKYAKFKIELDFSKMKRRR